VPNGIAVVPHQLAALFQGLEAAGIPWCLLRPLPHWDRPRSGDVDLLVAPGRLPPASAAGLSAGFVVVPDRGTGRHLLLFDGGLPGWIWVHLVDELCFGARCRLQTHAEFACLERSTKVDDLRHLNPDDEFWATLLHCLLDKRSIAPRHRARLRDLAPAAATDGPLGLHVARVCPPSWTPARIVAAAAQDAWGPLEKLVPVLQNRWPSRAPTRPNPGSVVRVREAFRFRLRAARRRGLSVALLGPDGAGKTTLAGEIADGFVFPVRRVYMGLTGGWLRHVNRLRVPGIVLLGRLAILWGRYLRARWLQAGGALVVFDRYVYDAVAPTPYPLSRLGRLSRRIAGRACPAPDLVLVLSAPGDVMFRRKGSYSAAQLEDWRGRYLQLSRRLPNVEVVDTTRPLDVVRNDAIGRIWRCYERRWR
jgi:thymidylate kinase